MNEETNSSYGESTTKNHQNQYSNGSSGPGSKEGISTPSEFFDFLKRNDFHFKPVYDGQIYREDRAGGKGNLWHVSRILKFDDLQIHTTSFGDWRTSEKHNWRTECNLSPQQQAALTKQYKKFSEEERKAKEAVWAEVASKLEADFLVFYERGTTPYMNKKQVKFLYGCRIAPSPRGDGLALVVPMRDADGKFWNYQKVFSEKINDNDKFFSELARVEACFHALQPIPENPERIHVAEGFATAEAIQRALPDERVICAFNAGNLLPVCQALAKRYPNAKIVVCADNDAYTVVNGVKTNPGLEKGRQAAGAVGGKVCWPVFKNPKEGLTDYNDLLCTEGIERVIDQLFNPAKYLSGIQPMLIKMSIKGKAILPSEKQVSDYLLKEYGDRIVRQGKNLFKYCGTHWVELDAVGVDQIKQHISTATEHHLGSRELENYFRSLVINCPSVPHDIDLFQPNPFAANFSDGTLHLRKISEGKGYSTEFLTHNRADYLTSVLPFKFPQGELLKHDCPQFDAFLDQVWAKDPDREDKKKLFYQIGGACLIPAFAKIVFFVGPPKSAKSTLIKFLVRLMSQQNVCSVQLCDMNGFNMESMVGKLINFDCDIDIQKPINDSEVKKIIDRVPRRIRRKNRSDAYGYLPTVHLFGSNDLPPSLDGASHAYERRMVVIVCDSFTAPDNYIHDYEVFLLEKEQQGIINRMYQGLLELAASGGHYHIPPSSRENVKRLEDESDYLGQFISEARTGELISGQSQLTVDESGKIAHVELWENWFKPWFERFFPRRRFPTKTHVYTRLAKEGFETKCINGYYYFKGLQAGKKPGALF